MEPAPCKVVGDSNADGCSFLPQAVDPFLVARPADEHRPGEVGVDNIPGLFRAKGRIAQFQSSARHFQIWLARNGAAIKAIDDAVLRRFRHHDCRCVRTKRGHLLRRERPDAAGSSCRGPSGW